MPAKKDETKGVSQVSVNETDNFTDSLAAYEKVAAEIAAVKEDQLGPINVEIMASIATVIGALPGIERFAEELATLPYFDAKQYANLKLYTFALSHAHTSHLRNTTPPEIAELAQEGITLRDTLVHDIEGLGKRGLIDASVLEKLKGTQGYRNLAFDLGALANILHQALPQVKNKTAVDEAEITRARVLSDKLITTVGLRERDPQEASASALTRQKAFTLFYNAYDQVRRGITYLRWDEGDANEIAPSLYERRASKRKGEAVVIETPVPPATVGVAAAKSPQVAAAPEMEGLPGGDPFERG
jgi:hypothetical protein